MYFCDSGRDTSTPAPSAPFFSLPFFWAPSPAVVSGRLHKPHLHLRFRVEILCSPSQTQHASLDFDYQIPV